MTTSSLSQAESVIRRTVTSSDGKTSGVVKSGALACGGAATATLADGSKLQVDSTISVIVT